MTEESDTIETVASALDAVANGEITLDEFNMQIHDKRYHKHGYKDGDVCKYRDETNNPKADSKEAIQRYESFGHDVSFPEAEHYLKSSAGIHVFHASNQQELEDGGFAGVDALNLMEWGTPVSSEIHQSNVHMFYEVYKDLTSRFEGFSLMHPYLTSWRFKDEKNNRALTSLDKQRGVRTNYIILGDNITNDVAPLNPFHIIRHEIAHSLTTSTVSEKAKSIVKDIGVLQWVDLMRRQVSARATVDIEEGIAEIFAKYTAPGYKKGSMADKLEGLAEFLLNLKQGGIAMDSDEHSQREGVPPLNPIYLVVFDSFEPEPKGIIRWRDNALNKYVEFNTYEERMRYIHKCYGVPKEWTDEFCSKYPDYKWSVVAVQMIIHEYRNTEKPLGVVLKESEKWL